MLERRGVISGYEGSKPRQVLITQADLPRRASGGDAASPRPMLPPAVRRAGDRRHRPAARCDAGVATIGRWTPESAATLREARNRRKVDLSEVEEATKIRLRYLRAIENEEWDVLPGGPTRAASSAPTPPILGLDGERLAEDYRRAVEADGDSGRAGPHARAVGGAGQHRRGPRLSTRAAGRRSSPSA